MKVDLPQPDGPMKAVTALAFTAQVKVLNVENQIVAHFFASKEVGAG